MLWIQSVWRWKSQNRVGRPKADRELRDLIRRMSKENPRRRVRQLECDPLSPFARHSKLRAAQFAGRPLIQTLERRVETADAAKPSSQGDLGHGHGRFDDQLFREEDPAL